MIRRRWRIVYSPLMRKPKTIRRYYFKSLAERRVRKLKDKRRHQHLHDDYFVIRT